ncbi:hypothetical protein STEG23_024546 [Scotinomys teguina]
MNMSSMGRADSHYDCGKVVTREVTEYEEDETNTDTQEMAASDFLSKGKSDMNVAYVQLAAEILGRHFIITFYSKMYRKELRKSADWSGGQEDEMVI